MCGDDAVGRAWVDEEAARYQRAHGARGLIWQKRRSGVLHSRGKGCFLRFAGIVNESAIVMLNYALCSV